MPAPRAKNRAVTGSPDARLEPPTWSNTADGAEPDEAALDGCEDAAACDGPGSDPEEPDPDEPELEEPELADPEMDDPELDERGSTTGYPQITPERAGSVTRSSPPTWSTTSSGEEADGSGSIDDADGTVELDGTADPAGAADAPLSVGRAEVALGAAAVPEAEVPKTGAKGAAAP